MKLLLTLFISIFFTTTFSLKKEEIPVTIHFNFDKNIQFEKGTITVKETNQMFEISSLEDFIIPLKKGKYTIIFYSEKFGKYSIKKKINEKNNVYNLFIKEYHSLEIQQEITEENIVKQIETGTANFINFGLGMQDYTAFKEKYNVGNHNLGCVIAGNMSEEAKLNNQYIANYLDEKYGEDWRKDVPFLPWGLE